MSRPSLATLFDVIDATWPCAARIEHGPWTLRRGAGGGSRVSAATTAGPVTSDQIDDAMAEMYGLDQDPIFMVRNGQEDFDAALEAKGLVIKDPVTLYSIALSDCGWPQPQRMTGFAMWPPLSVCLDIWQEGEIGPSRVAIMERAVAQKTALFGRVSDKPAGTGYVAINNKIAMLHALEVRKAHRQQGLGRELMYSAAYWADAHGATDLTILVTKANEPANGLYRSLGMTEVGGYHYRVQS